MSGGEGEGESEGEGGEGGVGGGGQARVTGASWGVRQGAGSGAHKHWEAGGNPGTPTPLSGYAWAHAGTVYVSAQPG